jgi:hypothetical protein
VVLGPLAPTHLLIGGELNLHEFSGARIFFTASAPKKLIVFFRDFGYFIKEISTKEGKPHPAAVGCLLTGGRLWSKTPQPFGAPLGVAPPRGAGLLNLRIAA